MSDFKLETEDEAEPEPEVVGMVEEVEESTAELDDWTEEEVLDCAGLLDDGEDTDETSEPI